ncbi:lytic transglycosylase [Nocardia donostiensis]|uniref:Lytic transglycosylase n=4 Tax=Nocardia donostiensis TaxID=1538463 RepID=A0A1V2TMG7_9NOCA|nr:lytic transglycosylase [Nocardia donostiensis]
MRIPTPIAMSALVVAGLVASGSATNTVTSSAPPEAPESLLTTDRDGTTENNTANATTSEEPVTQTLGMLPVSPQPPRNLRALSPPADGIPLFAGTVPLHTLTLPAAGNALGIPEIVLAAYRNAELALESSMPGCGLTWNLLAGIGRIESGHAGNGRTDAAGTTLTPIFGPALDGTLPGNEIIRAADGSYVRALGPMQFLPSTWSRYAADGNGDGVADPHNVFDATLAAGKYLCSGGLNLRDRAQELKAVLRYNNSMRYAADVLSWSAAYRAGGSPTPVPVSPHLVPPGSAPIEPRPDMTAVDTQTATEPPETPAPPLPDVPTPVIEPMIIIPGLPPIPCGIFCPPAPSGPPTPVPAPMPVPGPVKPDRQVQAAPAGPRDPVAPQDPAAPAPQTPGQPEHPPEPAPQPPPAGPAPQPVIRLPFGIVIPLPAPPR